MAIDIFSEIASESPKGDLFTQISSSEKKPEETKIHPAKAIVQQAGRKFVSHALASPRSIAELISFAADYLPQQENPQQKNVVKGLKGPETLLNKINYPSAEKFEEMLKAFGEKFQEQTPIEPETIGQERAANIGAFGGQSVLGGPKNLLKRVTAGFLGGIGAQGAKEGGAGAGGEAAGAIGLPAIISLVQQIRSGKFKPSTKELQELQKAAEQFGLTEAEMTPLLQSKAKEAVLSKIAKPTGSSANTLEKAETKLADAYENIKKQASTKGSLPREKQIEVLNRFDDIATDLKKSALPGDDKIKAIEKIEKAINQFARDGISAEGIIETWQDINKTVNWKSYANGKRDLAKLKEPLKKALGEIDPKLSKDFENINKLWGKLKNISSKLTDKDLKKWVDYGEAYALLGGVIQGVSTGNWKTVGAVIGTELTRRLATKMLTDPKYQDIFRRSANAIASGNKAAGLKAFHDLKKDIEKDYPEESKGVDWSKFK